jgi:UDP-glucose 4-epimerase
MEYLLKDMSMYKWFQVICLRYFNPIGAHSTWLLGENPNGIPNNLLPYIFKVASWNLSKVNVFGNDYPTSDGTWIRDYIHVMDLADAHLSAYRKIWLPNFEVFNIWTGYWTSVIEIITMVQNITQKTIPYEVVVRRAWDVSISLANSSKAYQILWWKSSRTIEEAIKDWWNFICSH